MSVGGSGSGINSVIEAEQRARELGSPPQPDAADERAERAARRAAWVIAGIATIGGAWLVAGPGAAAVTFGALTVGVLAVWRLRAWLKRPARETPQAPP